MRFLGRWLSHSLATALALVFGILAMQAPSFTREYVGALLQIATDARRDIDQREAAARQFYGIAATQDDDVVNALRPREPSNAETLASSLDRTRTLRRAYDDIVDKPALLQPIVALGTMIDDSDGRKKAVWALALANYDLQLDLSVGSAIYGIAGLMLGSLIAQSVLTLAHRAVGPRDARFARR